MTYKMSELIAKAGDFDQQEYARKEQDKIGVLRAGNSGIMSDHGEIAGQCHRKAHLRQLGIEIDPPEASTRIMFELGFGNEDRIKLALGKAFIQNPSITILQEEECPIEWSTTNGTKVTGRPDLVILESDKRVLGLELKSVHSVWVARDCLFSGTPKIDNVIQAAHYSWKLEVPYKLWYRQYSQQSIPKFGFQTPAPGEKYSEFVEYNPQGGAKHVKQFDIVYDIDIDDKGVVRYKPEAESKWTKSIVTTVDIGRFYEFVSNMSYDKDLGPDFTLIDVQGKPGKYDHSAYCTACQLATESGNDYSKWLDLVHAYVTQKKSTKVSGRNADKVVSTAATGGK